jgi:chromosome segregation ATPase
MFQVMCEYKGREDLTFIAQEFVTKEKQLQKIEEYVAQLESRIEQAQSALRGKLQEDKALQQEVNAHIEKDDARYLQLQGRLSADIRQLKAQETQFFAWF